MAYLEVGARYCSHCGAHSGDVSAIPEVSELGCPRCSSEMKLSGIPIGLHHGEACPRCEGLWVSQKVFEQVVADFAHPEKQRPKDGGIIKPRTLTAPSTRSFETTVKYLPCPVCAVHMTRRNYLRISGVILDFCVEHGVWLDRNELRHVADFLQEGGVARSQIVDQKEAKLKARHEGEIRRLEAGVKGQLGESYSWPSGINDRPSLEVNRLLKWIWEAVF
jgi:Zn-finger nucleic acid-binding protein